MAQAHDGGCLCGAVRYRIDSIFDVVYCHCTICRKTSGGPVFLAVIVQAPDFHLLKGELAQYRSSNGGRRGFCSRCGSQISFTAPDWPYVSISHGSLDAPEHVLPRIHQWTQSALSWFKIADDLPRVPDGQLPHPDLRQPGPEP